MGSLLICNTHYSLLTTHDIALFSHKIIPLGLPVVAVVILNYNGRKHLENFLPSVMASMYTNLRVIVADNASTDDSVAYIQQYFSKVEILTHPVNEGFAGGYNWALQEVQSDYYVLLNSDVSVTPGWIGARAFFGGQSRGPFYPVQPRWARHADSGG